MFKDRNERPEAICSGPAADSTIYEYVPCSACGLSHLVNKSTGKLIGEKEKD